MDDNISTPNYQTFYEGGFSSLDSEYGNFVGHRLYGGEVGQSMNPSTANQLDETMKTLKTGTQEVEVQMLNMQDVDQTIPKEHFKEMRQLLKISGARASAHAPIADPAGFNEQGTADEMEREKRERRFMDSVEKAHELDPKGNIPVVFHAAGGIGGSTPGKIYKIDKTKKPGEEGRMVLDRSYAINRESGQTSLIKTEKKFYPSRPQDFEKGGTLHKPEEQVDTINATEWENKLTELAQFNKNADEVIGSAPLYLKDLQNAITNGQVFVDKDTREEIPVTPQQVQNYNKMKDADIFLENVRMNFSGAFDKAYKYGTEEQKEELRKLADDYAKGSGQIGQNEVFQPVKRKELLKESIERLKDITSGVNPAGTKIDINYGAPKVYQDSEEYALDKSSETFSNVALDSYDKFGKSMPVLAIENWAPGTGFNTAEDLQKLVKESRKKFTKKLQDEKGFSESKAKEIAKKQIGATWDVGHLNLYKQHGFTDEDLALETAKIAKDVKHLHLTDNFGFSDSHLVPGMGNVPFKKHLEKLEKAGTLKKVRKIVEAGNYIQQISKQGVHGESIAAFGSPIYGAQMPTYWNQTEKLMGSYFGGYGVINPTTHHNVYGAGFTTLPTELGGTIPGGGSRFSGNSMS